MTCKNNIMGSKKKSTKGIFYLLVWMMMSYGAFGSKIPPQKLDIVDVRNVLTTEIIHKVLGEDEKFKKCIDNIGKIEEFKVKYAGCCCCRGNVCDAWVCSKNGYHRSAVYNLIYGALDVKDDHSVQLRDSGSTLSEDTGVYQYIRDNNVVWALNNAIAAQALNLKNKLH